MKTKIISLIMTTILTLSIGAAAQTKPPKFLLINSLKEDANYVLDTDSLEELMNKPGGISDRDVQSMKATKERAEKALQKIKQLFDEQTPESEPIKLANVETTLGELSERILAINRDASMVVLMSELYQAGMGASAWLEDLSGGKKLNSEQADTALFQGKRLMKAVTEAQKLGFPESYNQELRGQGYNLEQMKELAQYITTAADERAKAIAAERAAKDAPFLKVLTGDKLRIFKQEFAGMGGEWLCLGPGGVSLNTPEQMKNASVWFTYGNNRGLIDTWHITGFRFSGDKLSGRVSRNGYGLKPSAANFR